VGALVSKAHFDKMCGYLSQEQESQIVMGSQTSAGAFVEPTIIDVGGNDAPLAREEIFRPILSMITVRGFDEAIALANETDYGLAASIFTSNVNRAIRGARAIRAGTVTVNCFGEGDISTPFGGYKPSGFGGRDNSIHAHDQYTQLKTIWLDLTGTVDDGVA
jgi:4-(gamma-glutamylamino)butanal dehydrogenase